MSQHKFDIRHRKTRRMFGHDYNRVGTYMVTMTVQERLPLLGQLAVTGEMVKVKLSPLGEHVEKCIQRIAEFWPMLEIWQVCIMPDHVHIIVHIKNQMPEGKHLGHALGGMKIGATKALWELAQQGHEPFASFVKRMMKGLCVVTHSTVTEGMEMRHAITVPVDMSAAPSSAAPSSAARKVSAFKKTPLFETGYNDLILFTDEELLKWKRYLADNPRRLWLKRSNKNLFTILRDWHLAGYTLQSVGNHQLLRHPNKQVVRWHRYYKNQPEVWERLRKQWIDCAAQGGVLISPAIAPEEREVMNEAMENGYRVVMVKDNGFSEHYKPMGKYFDACAQGTLLEVTPWNYSTEKREMKRTFAMSMNELAEELANI